MAATGNELIVTHYARPVKLSVWSTGGFGARRVPMVLAVPGYGLTMTFAQMNASTGVDNYELVALAGRPRISDVKTFG